MKKHFTRSILMLIASMIILGSGWDIVTSTKANNYDYESQISSNDTESEDEKSNTHTESEIISQKTESDLKLNSEIHTVDKIIGAHETTVNENVVNISQNESEEIKDVSNDNESGDTVKSEISPEIIQEQDTYTFSDVENTLYTTVSLNYRDEPSINGKQLGSLPEGTKVTTYRKCNETGWYEVEIKNEKVFMSGKYLTDKKPNPSETLKDIATAARKKGLGSAGRLVVPQVGINVKLKKSRDQSDCNKKDLACVFGWGEVTLIADHKHQGFNKITSITKNTPIYIVYKDHVDEYKLVAESMKGINDETEIYWKKGTVLDKKFPGKTCMYTCAKNSHHGRNIYIEVIEKVKKHNI